MEQQQQKQGREQRHRRRFRGVVVGTAMAKTANVRVERIFRHPMLKRVVRRHRTFLVHDAKGLARVGDHVLIEECRPLSRKKRWQLLEILSRGSIEEDEHPLPPPKAEMV
jgi:small subunit ribosomal protein S17